VIDVVTGKEREGERGRGVAIGSSFLFLYCYLFGAVNMVANSMYEL
jgi:hypothetical protein